MMSGAPDPTIQKKTNLWDVDFSFDNPPAIASTTPATSFPSSTTESARQAGQAAVPQPISAPPNIPTVATPPVQVAPVVSPPPAVPTRSASEPPAPAHATANVSSKRSATPSVVKNDKPRTPVHLNLRSITPAAPKSGSIQESAPRVPAATPRIPATASTPRQTHFPPPLASTSKPKTGVPVSQTVHEEKETQEIDATAVTKVESQTTEIISTLPYVQKLISTMIATAAFSHKETEEDKSVGKQAMENAVAQEEEKVKKGDKYAESEEQKAKNEVLQTFINHQKSCVLFTEAMDLVKQNRGGQLTVEDLDAPTLTEIKDTFFTMTKEDFDRLNRNMAANRSKLMQDIDPEDELNTVFKELKQAGEEADRKLDQFREVRDIISNWRERLMYLEVWNEEKISRWCAEIMDLAKKIGNTPAVPPDSEEQISKWCTEIANRTKITDTTSHADKQKLGNLVTDKLKAFRDLLTDEDEKDTKGFFAPLLAKVEEIRKTRVKLLEQQLALITKALTHPKKPREKALLLASQSALREEIQSVNDSAQTRVTIINAWQNIRREERMLFYLRNINSLRLLPPAIKDTRDAYLVLLKSFPQYNKLTEMPQKTYNETFGRGVLPLSHLIDEQILELMSETVLKELDQYVGTTDEKIFDPDLIRFSGFYQQLLFVTAYIIKSPVIQTCIDSINEKKSAKEVREAVFNVKEQTAEILKSDKCILRNFNSTDSLVAPITRGTTAVDTQFHAVETPCHGLHTTAHISLITAESNQTAIYLRDGIHNLIDRMESLAVLEEHADVLEFDSKIFNKVTNNLNAAVGGGSWWDWFLGLIESIPLIGWGVKWIHNKFFRAPAGAARAAIYQDRVESNAQKANAAVAKRQNVERRAGLGLPPTHRRRITLPPTKKTNKSEEKEPLLPKGATTLSEQISSDSTKKVTEEIAKKQGSLTINDFNKIIFSAQQEKAIRTKELDCTSSEVFNQLERKWKEIAIAAGNCPAEYAKKESASVQPAAPTASSSNAAATASQPAPAAPPPVLMTPAPAAAPAKT
jgi:hypothetical protein